MVPRYSIADARNRFAEIVHALKHVPQVEVTRRGRPVAVLISVEEFERLRAGGAAFWSAYSAYREAYDLVGLNIEPEVFEGTRKPSPGREMDW
jgi:prevent-host-death family protein